MKILIGFLLALFISGQAYAVTPAEIPSAEILGKGKVVSSVHIGKSSDFHQMIVIYKSKIYRCHAYPYKDDVYCWEMRDH
tara:strand:- start:268 stop:507 length:240 start_codon:yes stop_codon:yes gene_type:complete